MKKLPACITVDIEGTAWREEGEKIHCEFSLMFCKGFNHYPQFVGSICEEECGELLRELFKRKRNKKLSESK